MGRNFGKVILAFSFAWQLGIAISLILIGSSLLGLWLDKKFHTLPLFLRLSFFLGLLLIITQIYQWLLPILKDKQNDRN